jgi:hypothetical protein
MEDPRSAMEYLGAHDARRAERGHSGRPDRLPARRTGGSDRRCSVGQVRLDGRAVGYPDKVAKAKQVYDGTYK